MTEERLLEIEAMSDRFWGDPRVLGDLVTELIEEVQRLQGDVRYWEKRYDILLSSLGR